MLKVSITSLAILIVGLWICHGAKAQASDQVSNILYKLVTDAHGNHVILSWQTNYQPTSDNPSIKTTIVRAGGASLTSGVQGVSTTNNNALSPTVWYQSVTLDYAPSGGNGIPSDTISLLVTLDAVPVVGGAPVRKELAIDPSTLATFFQQEHIVSVAEANPRTAQPKITVTPISYDNSIDLTVAVDNGIVQMKAFVFPGNAADETTDETLAVAESDVITAAKGVSMPLKLSNQPNGSISPSQDYTVVVKEFNPPVLFPADAQVLHLRTQQPLAVPVITLSKGPFVENSAVNVFVRGHDVGQLQATISEIDSSTNQLLPNPQIVLDKAKNPKIDQNDDYEFHIPCDLKPTERYNLKIDALNKNAPHGQPSQDAIVAGFSAHVPNILDKLNVQFTTDASGNPELIFVAQTNSSATLTITPSEPLGTSVSYTSTIVPAAPNPQVPIKFAASDLKASNPLEYKVDVIAQDNSGRVDTSILVISLNLNTTNLTQKPQKAVSSFMTGVQQVISGQSDNHSKLTPSDIAKTVLPVLFKSLGAL